MVKRIDEQKTYTEKEMTKKVLDYTRWLLNEELGGNNSDEDISELMFRYGFCYGGED